MLPASGIMVFETENHPETRNTQRMLPPERPDRIYVAFDDHRLVANAGLVLPVTLAHHLGLCEPVDHHVDLGDAPGRANAGDKMLTLAASALAGGDCIDDADALRAARWRDRAGAGLRGQGTIHAGDLPSEEHPKRASVPQPRRPTTEDWHRAASLLPDTPLTSNPNPPRQQPAPPDSDQRPERSGPRLTKLGYWLAVIAIAFLTFVLAGGLNPSQQTQIDGSTILLFLVMYLPVAVLRARDMGFSWWSSVVHHTRRRRTLRPLPNYLAWNSQVHNRPPAMASELEQTVSRWNRRLHRHHGSHSSGRNHNGPTAVRGKPAQPAWPHCMRHLASEHN